MSHSNTSGKQGGGNPALAKILLLSAAIIWGASYIVTKSLFQSEPQITTPIIITGRLLIASIVTIPVLLLGGKLQRVARKDWPFFVLLAFVEPFLYSLCETTGIKYVSGTLASIMIALIPLACAFGVALVYRERVLPNVFIGIVLSLVGVALMVWDGNSDFSASLKGLLFLVGAIIIAVVFNLLLVKVVERYNAVTITTYQNALASLMFLPIVLLTSRAELATLSFSPAMFFKIGFLGIFCSAIAYMFYNYGVRTEGASKAVAYSNLIPVFSLVAAFSIGQETITWAKAAGVAVVIVGLFVAQRNKK